MPKRVAIIPHVCVFRILSNYSAVFGICVTSLIARNMNKLKLPYEHGIGYSSLREYFAIRWKHHSLH